MNGLILSIVLGLTTAHAADNVVYKDDSKDGSVAGIPVEAIATSFGIICQAHLDQNQWGLFLLPYAYQEGGEYMRTPSNGPCSIDTFKTLNPYYKKYGFSGVTQSVRELTFMDYSDADTTAQQCMNMQKDAIEAALNSGKLNNLRTVELGSLNSGNKGYVKIDVQDVREFGGDSITPVPAPQINFGPIANYGSKPYYPELLLQPVLEGPSNCRIISSDDLISGLQAQDADAAHSIETARAKAKALLNSTGSPGAEQK
jgi:hypothetical protein